MRYHGDEFAILAPAESEKELVEVAKRLTGFKVEVTSEKIETLSFTFGSAFEEEVEVMEIVNGLARNGGSLFEAGNLFTALNFVADTRER